MPNMELLLHYTWQQRMFPLRDLTTTDGQTVEVIDVGLHNHNAGPDFFNAKVKINNTMWVGNVEVHRCSSDWYKHEHDKDERYKNVVLHVVEHADCDVFIDGKRLPQMVLSIPEELHDKYNRLLKEEHYPPCYRCIPNIPRIMQRQWFTQLGFERLAQKTNHIQTFLDATHNDWEHALFITIARNFGFGVNNDAFERWAKTMPLNALRKHRNNAFQVEALFFGTAGLLDADDVEEAKQDAYFKSLKSEWDFLKHKFSIEPIKKSNWKFLRMRPQNFVYSRLSQLHYLYQAKEFHFSQLLDAECLEDFYNILQTQVTGYWTTHFTFGGTTQPEHNRRLNKKSLQLLIINTIAPLLFCYGKHHNNEAICEKAYGLLEQLKPESNYITRAWNEVGITAENAADSQAMIQLQTAYCDRKDCLRCRFGRIYLKASPNQNTRALSQNTQNA
jgi:hypothetical protein